MHFDPLRVLGVALDFEVAGLRTVFRPGLQLERVLPDSQPERRPAVDVKVIRKRLQLRLPEAHRPAAAALQMHPRDDGLARLRVDHFDRQLAVAPGRGVRRPHH